MPVRRFQTLGELIGLYAQPNQGLVCALLLPVERERELDPPDERDASGAAQRTVCPAVSCPIPGVTCGFPPRLSACLPQRSLLLTVVPGLLPTFPGHANYPCTSLRARGSHGCPLALVHRWGG